MYRVTHERIQRIPYKLRVSFSGKYGWSKFTCSLGLRNPVYNQKLVSACALYIRAVHAMIDLHCAVEYTGVCRFQLLSRLSRSVSLSLIASDWDIESRLYCVCTIYVDDLYHILHLLFSYWGCGEISHWKVTYMNDVTNRHSNPQSKDTPFDLNSQGDPQWQPNDVIANKVHNGANVLTSWSPQRSTYRNLRHGIYQRQLWVVSNCNQCCHFT